ncbi:MAG TPA: hypothetical protein DD806_02525 [Flavobacterium sp.]|nr:hypothetical protein [Flavobacterium sp.]
MKRVRLQGVFLETPKKASLIAKKGSSSTATKRKSIDTASSLSGQSSKRVKYAVTPKSSSQSQSQDPLNDKQQERFSHRMKKRNTSFNSSYTPTCGRKQTVKRKILAKSCMPTIEEQNEMTFSYNSQEKAHENLSSSNDKVLNGLVQDVNYYNIYTGQKTSFPLAKFDFGSRTPWTVNFRDFRTLDYRSWLSGEIVDILIKLRFKKYFNFHYIDHSTTKKIIEGEIIQTEQVFDMSYQRLVTTYCYSSHWFLIVLDIGRKLFIVVDPKKLHVTSKYKIWMTKYLGFLRTAGLVSEDRWKFGFVMSSQIELPKQPIDDPANCGIFVILYVDLMFGKSVTKEPIALRSLYQLEILNKSLSMIKYCLFCGKNFQNTIFKTLCTSCHRWLCCKCVKNPGSEHEFECFLCKDNPFVPGK